MGGGGELPQYSVFPGWFLIVRRDVTGVGGGGEGAVEREYRG